MTTEGNVSTMATTNVSTGRSISYTSSFAGTMAIGSVAATTSPHCSCPEPQCAGAGGYIAGICILIVLLVAITAVAVLQWQNKLHVITGVFSGMRVTQQRPAGNFYNEGPGRQEATTSPNTPPDKTPAPAKQLSQVPAVRSRSVVSGDYVYYGPNIGPPPTPPATKTKPATDDYCSITDQVEEAEEYVEVDKEEGGDDYDDVSFQSPGSVDPCHEDGMAKTGSHASFTSDDIYENYA
eukprot:scpid64985/ scgid8420/ 